MKNLFTLLFFLLIYCNARAQSSCNQSCPIPTVGWNALQCEHYENFSTNQDLWTDYWFPYPAQTGYNPIPAKVQLGNVGNNGWVWYADFIFKSKPIDNYYLLDITNRDYRFSFDIYVWPNKKANFVIKNSSLSDIAIIYFQGNGTAEIFNNNNVKIGSFTYPQGSWINMNLFYHSSGSMEIFRNSYKVSNLTGFSTSNSGFPSKMNFFSEKSGDEFLLGGVCLVTQNGLDVICSQDINPICLNGTNEEVATNSCWARVKGYLTPEFHECNKTNNPCDDCDECFSYWFDCTDYRKIYFQNNYCDIGVPTLYKSSNGKESLTGTEYEWEFKNSNNTIIQPEYFNNTSNASYSPICRIPLPGTYTVCLRVYKYQENGRYVAFTCCYTILVAQPCTSSPTLYINAGTANSNNEVSLTATSPTADNFSWRIDDSNAYINGQSQTTNAFKCKIPTGKNCVTICLTVGNGCGMTSECITVCNNNNPCGTRPATTPPITYSVSQSGDVTFTNIPQMDSYNWVLPSGCTFGNGSSPTSKNPTCHIPDVSCNYLFCVNMKFGDCYHLCYCFTIRRGSTGGTITFDPDEIPCVPNNTEFRVPVRVKGFTNMSSVELTYTISPTNVANFVKAEDGPNIQSGSIIPVLINNSKLQVGWYGTAGVNTTLQDNDILCYLVLNSTGSANSNATISIESNSALVKQNRIDVTPELKTGSICINGTYKICGKILTEDNRPVKNVTVTINGSASSSTITDAQGLYCFNSLPSGNYTLKPNKTNFPGNGVGVSDIADLKGQLLGTYTLPSPYTIIAADVDNNKRLDATDIARIIPTYKDKNRQFPSVDSWRFIPKSYQFPNALNPFQSSFPELASVQLNKDESSIDFTGIKMGDLDLNRDPQNIINNDHFLDIPNNLHQRTSIKLDLIIPSDTVKPGSTLRIPIYCNGFKNVTAFEFSLNWQKDKLRFLSVNKFNSKLGINQSDFGLANASNGNFGVNWFTFDINGVSLIDKEPLFYVEFQVLANNNETTTLSFTDFPTPISFADPNESFEINRKSGTILIDQTAVAVKDVDKGKSGCSIYPNPASNKLMITNTELDLSQAELKISSMDGRIFTLSQVKRNIHLVQLDVENLPAGTYLLRISTKNETQIIPFVKI